MIAVRKGYADLEHGQIHYHRVDGPGPPIVLLHRTPASSSSFLAMLNILRGRRAAIAFDTPGFGESFRPAGMPATIDYARWFLAAIDVLEIEDFHLCGHHTGTHFAAEMALLAPERVKSLLLNGVLVMDQENRAKMRADIGLAKRVDPEGTYLANLWQTMFKLFPNYDGELVHAELVGALRAIDGRDQAFAAICEQDFEAVLAQVQCPIAIVQASDDPLNPMLNRVRGRYPAISIRSLGPAYIAAPECQAQAYADAAIAFASKHEMKKENPAMTERRFKLVRGAGGYDLEQTVSERPAPGPGEVLVRMRAVSLNRRDISIRDLSYPVFDADHFTPLSDGAGEVVEVGESVSGLAVGDRVCSTFFQNWESGRPTFAAAMSALGGGGQGVFADYVLLSEHGVARVPDNWSYEEGACLACAGVTAWSALMRLGQMQAGDWVLIIGTGGVAIFALQIAVAAGARVVILSSSDEKLDRAKQMGAEVAINYRATPDWVEAVKKATDGGVHHAVELGGNGTLAKSVGSLTVGGHLALIGALDGFGGELAASNLIVSALKVSAVLVGPRSDHLALAQFLSEHDIRPVIDSAFDANEAEAAYARATEGAFGKVVIRMN